MRAVVQRVTSSSVVVDGETVGAINQGYMVLLGVETEDTLDDGKYLSEKVLNLRVFEDENGKLNKSILDIKGELLIISQFTLQGDCRKGRRPSFIKAARPDQATTLYEAFVGFCKDSGLKTETGVFQAHMDVSLVNDGPVTILLDSKKVF